MSRFILLLVCLVMLVTRVRAGENPVLYRIRTNEPIDIDSTFITTNEAEFIARLEYVLSKCPERLWLVSVNGKLRAVKLGKDGKPVK